MAGAAILSSLTQGSYPFSETIFQDFSRTFPGFRLFFQDYKIHLNSFTLISIKDSFLLSISTHCQTYK